MPLIVLMRLALLPVLLVLSLIYGVIILFFIRETILEGHDRSLRAITGSVAAFVDVDEHKQIMEAEQVSGLAVLGDRTIALNIKGQLLSLDMSDEDKLAQASLLWSPNGSLRLFGNLAVASNDRVYALCEDRGQFGIAAVDFGGEHVLVEKTAIVCSQHHSQLVYRQSDKKIYVLEYNKTLQAVDPSTATWDTQRCVFNETINNIASDGERIIGSRGASLFTLGFNKNGFVAMDPLNLELDDETYIVQSRQLLGLAYADEQIYLCADRLYICASDDLSLTQVGYPGFRSEANKRYQRYTAAFNGIRNDTGVGYMYTCLVRGQEAQIVYALDANNYEDGSGNSLIGSVDSELAHGDLKRAWFLRAPQFTDIEYYEEWGWIKSGFWPIIDDEGNAVAIIGADMKAKEIVSKMNQATVVIGALQVALVLLVLLVTVLTSRRISRKIELVKDAALMLAAGRFDQNISYDLPPELEKLARQLNKYGADLMTLEKENMWKSERFTRV